VLFLKKVARKGNNLEVKKESEIDRDKQNQTITDDVVQRRPLLYVPYWKSFPYYQPDAAAENHGEHDTEYDESHNSSTQLVVNEILINIILLMKF
jgi:hypothetical protein